MCTLQVMDRMFHGELEKAEGRTILINELSKLYSDDDTEVCFVFGCFGVVFWPVVFVMIVVSTWQLDICPVILFLIACHKDRGVVIVVVSKAPFIVLGRCAIFAEEFEVGCWKAGKER